MNPKEQQPIENNLTTLPLPLRPGLRIPHTFRALGHRNFRLYWCGQLVSLIGTLMQTVGQGWLVYTLSGSTLALGVVGFAQFFPMLVLAPVGGVLADRVSKRHLLLLTQAGMAVLALALGLLTSLGLVQVWHVVALALLFGTLNAFDAPARQAFVVELVGKEDLMNAIALNSSAFNGARLLGPAVAGVLIAPLGVASLFYLNALAFLAIIVNLLRIRLPPFSKPPASSPWDSLLEGVHYLKEHKTLQALLSLIAASSVFGMAYVTLLPALVTDVLHSDASGYGFLMSAVAIGGLVAAFGLASAAGQRRKGVVLTWGNVTFSALLIVFSLSHLFWFSWLCLIGVGWGFLTQNATTNTLIQTLVPDALRGRVMSAFTWVLGGMFPIGSLIAGTLASWWGTDKAILVMALVLLSYSLWIMVFYPQVRRLS